MSAETSWVSAAPSALAAFFRGKNQGAGSNVVSDGLYEPLNLNTSSIRLVTILPELSSAGNIQCDMWEDGIAGNYFCLSYVWGTEHASHPITINGKNVMIRQNLLDFLMVARDKYAGSNIAFWIDALCIDQNSITERNHQVAQMGLIYSNARRVIGWLGRDQSVENALTFCAKVDTQAPATEEEAWSLRDPRVAPSFAQHWYAFSRNNYWKRAWITQEVLLAKSYRILVKDTEFELSKIKAISLLLPRLKASNDGSTHSNFYTYLEAVLGIRAFVGEDLLHLLERLPGRDCQMPRDRVYSLLAIATDKGIGVDYARAIHEIFARLIDVYESSMCLCVWTFLAEQLGMDPGIVFQVGYWGKEPTFTAATTAIVQPSESWTCSHCQLELDPVQEGQYSICVRSVCEHASRAHIVTTPTANYIVARCWDMLLIHDHPQLRVLKLKSKDVCVDLAASHINDESRMSTEITCNLILSGTAVWKLFASDETYFSWRHMDYEESSKPGFCPRVHRKDAFFHRQR